MKIISDSLFFAIFLSLYGSVFYYLCNIINREKRKIDAHKGIEYYQL